MTDSKKIETLKEVQKQMEEKYNDNDISSNPDTIDNESDNKSDEDNLIIKSIVTNKKRKTLDGEISCTLLAQHELDNKKMQKMIKKIYQYKAEISKLETQLYRLRLEFNNKDIEFREFQEKNNKTVKAKDKENYYYLIFLFISLFINFVIACF